MLTRTVRDCATLLDLASGAVPGDGFEIAPPAESYARAIETPPKALRVALCTRSWSGHPLDPEVVRVTREAGKRLEALGHPVEETSPDFDYETFLDAQKVIWAATTVPSLDELAAALGKPIDESQLQATTIAVYRHGQTLTAARLVTALGIYDQVTRIIGRFLARHDVLVTPTAAITPEPVGTYDPDRPGRTIDSVFEDLAPKETFTALFNGTGSPAISLPLGHTPSGLPVGVQLVASFGREDLLLGLARQLEQEYRWDRQRPALHVTTI
jgi:amidase